MTAVGRNTVPTLRDYQQKAVHEIRMSYRNGKQAPIFVLSTGAGKTIIFSYIAANSAQKGKKALILVHRIELLRQTAEKLRMFGVRVGLISPKYTPDLYAPIQVAMVQTMRRRTNLYRHFDLIITDECHHVVASTYTEVLAAYPEAYQLGVTATPVRSDGRGLGRIAGGVYDDIILGPSTAELIQMGHLSGYRIFCPPSNLDLSGIGRQMGDWKKKDLSERVNRSTIVGDAVSHYAKVCPGQPAVAFCVSVKDAEHVAERFRDAGYRAYSVDGTTDDVVRDRILSGLGNGTVDVVCSCDLISEGTDIPAIACAILLRPTQSEGLFLQQVGRALRPFPGKDKAIILDHVGNTLIHGLPDMERPWTLDGEAKKKRGKQEEKVIPIHQCESCYNVYRAHLRQCPHCGHERQFNGRKVETKDGELVELTPDQKAKISREKRSEVGKARTLEELQKIAQDRGYKRGWAQHVYNSRKK